MAQAHPHIFLPRAASDSVRGVATPLRESKFHIRATSDSAENLLPTDYMAWPEGSSPNLDEKKRAISTDEKHVDSVEVDLIHYHERCAGRLVLDPEFVCSIICSLLVVPLAKYASERRGLSSETRLPRDSSFHRMERLSSGLSHPMTWRTLKTCVHD